MKDRLKDLLLNHPGLLAVMFVVGTMFGVTGVWSTLNNLQTQQGEVTNRAQVNRLAIEKNCILLNNKIIESQATGSKSTALLIGEILKLANEHGDKKLVTEFQALASKQKSPILKTIDCKFVARHPEKIKAIPAKPPAPRKKP